LRRIILEEAAFAPAYQVWGYIWHGCLKEGQEKAIDRWGKFCYNEKASEAGLQARRTGCASPLPVVFPSLS